MNQEQLQISILTWLTDKSTQRENGIILLEDCDRSFELIHSFIENADDPFKTPVIYYRAFAYESAVNFFDTLGSELISKLGEHKLSQHQSLANIIKLAELQMVIIDKVELYPLDSLNKIVDLFANCNVCLILICSSRPRIKIASVLQHHSVSEWDKFSINAADNSLPTVC